MMASTCLADNFVSSGPLQVRNLSPITQLYGIPRVVGARVQKGGIETSLSVEIANNFVFSETQETVANFDGETQVVSFRIRGGTGGRFDWGAEIPYVMNSGGELDMFIDQFHELFGFSTGDRLTMPRNQTTFNVSQNGIDEVNLESAAQGIGDMRLHTGYSLFALHDRALALRAELKLPTGDVESLTGSEATDFSLWAEYERRVALGSQPVHMSFALGASFLGEGEFLSEDQNRVIGLGHFGLQFPVCQRWLFKAQLDGHTDVFDNPNGVIGGGGLLGTLGGRVNLTKKFWVDASVIEDLASSSAADVVFQLSLGADFSAKN